jgi:hypothetical protein
VLSRYLRLAERFTKRVVKTAKTAERPIIAEQIHDARMLFPGRGDHHEQLPGRSQPWETGFEVWTERLQLRPRHESVLERRLTETAQERTPMVVRTEQMIGTRIFVVLPSFSELSLESHHGLVRPCPVPNQAREAID